MSKSQPFRTKLSRSFAIQGMRAGSLLGHTLEPNGFYTRSAQTYFELAKSEALEHDDTCGKLHVACIGQGKYVSWKTPVLRFVSMVPLRKKDCAATDGPEMTNASGALGTEVHRLFECCTGDAFAMISLRR